MSEFPPPVYFIRHGETDWNRQGLIQGWTDTPLNDLGHTQAAAVGAALRGRAEISGCQFFVSPLLRARQSMAHVAAALDIPLQRIGIVPDVKELGFGVWEGRPFWELKASPVYPADAATRYTWRPEGGESYEDGHQRMRRWLDTLSGPTVVVAHGAIGRCLIGQLGGLSQAELVSLKTPQGCYCRIAGGRIEWFDATGVAA